MSFPTLRRIRLRWLCLSLAMLALGTLNLQSALHYQPRFLLAASLCSPGVDASNPDNSSGKQTHKMDCSLCCTQPQTGPGPVSEQRLAFVRQLVLEATLTVLTLALTTREWSPNGPRGPPPLL